MNCVLHIGAPKTGTTAIQRYFATKREVVALFYPEAGRYVGDVADNRQIGLRFAAMTKGRPNGLMPFAGLHTRAARLNYRQQFLNALDHELRGLSSNATVIFSDESLFVFANGACAAEIRAILEERFEKVQIVAYLRRPDKYLRASYSQHLKTGGTQSLESFVQAHSRPERQFSRRLEPWLAAFGTSRLLLRAFERDLLFRGDVVGDFLHLLGNDHARLPSRRSNPSLNDLGCEVLRQVNLRLGPDGSRRYRGILSRHLGGSEQHVLPYSLRSHVYERWADDHDQLKKLCEICGNSTIYDYDSMIRGDRQELNASIPLIAEQVVSTLICIQGRADAGNVEDAILDESL